MRRDLGFFSRSVFIGIFCLTFSIVFAQTSDRADLTGTYTGALKFPSENLNGKATLSVEGNKFRLRDAAGNEKNGRIMAIKTGGDYVSIALMFEETPSEKQPFAHSIMSVRLRKTGRNLTFTNAPGEDREFHFQAVAENANNKTEKISDMVLTTRTDSICADPKSANCGVNFGFVPADELEKVAAPKPVSAKNVLPKSKLPTLKPQNNKSAATILKSETAAENKQPEPAKVKTITSDAAKNETTILKKNNSFAAFKRRPAKSNKARAKRAVSTKSTAKKSASKSVVLKSPVKKEPAKTSAPAEKAKAPKTVETKPTPSPKPKPSPATSPTQNSNNANVGKGVQ